MILNLFFALECVFILGMIHFFIMECKGKLFMLNTHAIAPKIGFWDFGQDQLQVKIAGMPKAYTIDLVESTRVGKVSF